jgi:hypothetical protein
MMPGDILVLLSDGVTSTTTARTAVREGRIEAVLRIITEGMSGCPHPARRGSAFAQERAAEDDIRSYW